MIYLLGGSGYVGQAYQALLTRRGLRFRNLRRAEIDYTNPALLTAALRSMNPALEEASSTSGATPFTTFRKVTLRVLAPGLLAPLRKR